MYINLWYNFRGYPENVFFFVVAIFIFFLMVSDKMIHYLPKLYIGFKLTPFMKCILILSTLYKVYKQNEL